MSSKTVRKPLVLFLLGTMLLTFCFAPPPAEAIIFLVPAVVILTVTAVGGISLAIRDAKKSTGEKKKDHQEKTSTKNKPSELKPTIAEPAKG